MLDIKIIGGTVVDGICDKGYRADVGIQGDKIAKIGDLADVEAKLTIDGKDKIVSPGFIDMHTHSDLSLIYDVRACSRIYDGVTTQVIGNCGIGVAPICDERKDQLLAYLGTRYIGSIPVKLELPWNSMNDYLHQLEKNITATNVSALVAQGAIRINEMGFEKALPTKEQMDNMKAQVRKAMGEGCVGMSSGLVYMPGEFTTTDELVELCTEIAPFGGFYVSHIRSESDDLFQALEEAITIATKGGVPLHISHLKLSGPKVAGRTDEVFELFDKAHANGLDLSFDVYPYSAAMTSLGACISPWAFEGGADKMLERIKDPGNRKRIRSDIENGIPGWQNFAKAAGDWDGIIIASVVTNQGESLVGKTISQLAKEQNKDPYDVVFDTLIQENGRVQIIVKMMQEEDVAKIVSHPMSMIGSDGMNLSIDGLMSYGRHHPRGFGTCARVLSHYVRELRLITLEEAVKKMSSMPAWRLGMDRRGSLKEGYFADVLVFDFDRVKDMATYENPKQYSKGFETVIVNGQITLQNGVQTETLAGRVLRGRV